MPRIALSSVLALAFATAALAATTTPSAAPAQSHPRVAVDAKAETDAYTVELRAAGTYAKDAEGVAEIVIEAKDGFHINDEFPYKFTPKGGDGVTYKGPATREGAQIEKSRIILKLGVIPTRSGTATIAGKVSLSVCSDKNCVPGKHELSLDVSVN